jgi:L-lactate dehydrogenase complex protein LldG
MKGRNQVLVNMKNARGLRKNETKMPLFTEYKREELLAKWEKIEKQRVNRADQLIGIFKKECEQTQAKVYVVHTKNEACRWISSIIEQAGIKKLVKWRSPLLERLEIDDLLKSVSVHDVLGSESDAPNELRRSDYFRAASEAELGISGADYGLADTGTLVLRSLPGQERFTSLLPPVHVAILDSERILSSFDELIVKLQLDVKENAKIGSCVTLITGPSKTADIELNLILGVHGPKELHVIILSKAL